MVCLLFNKDQNSINLWSKQMYFAMAWEKNKIEANKNYITY